MKKVIILGVSICAIVSIVLLSSCVPNASSALEYVLNEDDLYEVSGYSGSGGEVIIPETYNGKAVVGIGESAFSGQKTITSITFPSSLLYVDSYAFEGCSEVLDFILPEGVTTLGDFVFKDCSKLKKITLPDTITQIGEGAFYACGGLSYDKYNDDLTIKYISNLVIGAISTNVTEINLYEESIGIYDYSFDNCGSVRKITIPSSVTFIGKAAFENMTTLNFVEIERDSALGIISLASDAFNGCAALSNIYLPNESSVNAYKASPLWADYANLISVIPAE